MRGPLLPGPETLVGDVQGREDRDLERVAGRGLARGELHLALDVGRQVGDVRGIEVAADRDTAGR